MHLPGVEEGKYDDDDDDDDESLPPPRLIFTKFAVAADTREDKGRAKATTDGDIDTVSIAAIWATARAIVIVLFVSSPTLTAVGTPPLEDA